MMIIQLVIGKYLITFFDRDFYESCLSVFTLSKKFQELSVCCKLKEKKSARLQIRLTGNPARYLA